MAALMLALFMLKLGVGVAMLLPGLGCPHPDDAGAILGVLLLLCLHPTVGGVGRGVTPVDGVITTTVGRVPEVDLAGYGSVRYGF